MKYVRTVSIVLFLAAAVHGQPMVTWNTATSETMEGSVVWFNNGNFFAQSFIGDGGSVSLAGMQAAHNKRAWILPSYIEQAAAAWGGQGQQEDPLKINVPKIIGPFNAAPALESRSGGAYWFFYVKWDNPQLAQSLGINAPINQLKIAVITDARKRTDGIPTGSLQSPLNADSTGSQLAYVPNIQYFSGGATTYRVILGLKQTVQGTSRSYVATIDPATGMQTVGWSGQQLVAYNSSSWPINYTTIRCKLKFD